MSRERHGDLALEEAAKEELEKLDPSARKFEDRRAERRAQRADGAPGSDGAAS